MCARAKCKNEASIYPVLELYATKLIIATIPNKPILIEFRELPTCLECSGRWFPCPSLKFAQILEGGQIPQ